MLMRWLLLGMFVSTSQLRAGLSGADAGFSVAENPETHRLTGYYRDSTGENAQFTCIFYFEGKLEGKKAELQSWFPEDPSTKIAGTLTVEGDEITVVLKEEHGGCWNVRHFAKATEPATFHLKKRTDWVVVRVVKSKKAYFHDGPGDKKRKAYVVQGDPVGVVATQGNWIKVQYEGNKLLEGWLASSELY